MAETAASLLGVFLVVTFGWIKLPCLSDFGDDGLLPIFLGVSASLKSLSFLIVASVENGGAVRITYVGALAVKLSRIMHSEEMLEERAIADLVWIKDDLNGFSVAGGVAANFLVSWVLGGAASVADFGFDDAGNLVKVVLDSPKAAGGEDSGLFLHLTILARKQPPGERRL